MQEKTTFGAHEIWREADTGLICLSHVGLMTEPEVAVHVDFLLTHQKPSEPGFLLADNRRATGITREGRALLATGRVRTEFEGYVAQFGAPLGVRALVSLMFKAMQVAVPIKIKLSIFATEAEARAWLIERRRATSVRDER